MSFAISTFPSQNSSPPAEDLSVTLKFGKFANCLIVSISEFGIIEGGGTITLASSDSAFKRLSHSYQGYKDPEAFLSKAKVLNEGIAPNNL